MNHPRTRIETTRFGPVEVLDEKLLDFGPGLLGFPEGRTFVIIEIEDDDEYFWLQSVELPDVAFLAIRPWSFFPDYELDVPDAVAAEIELHDPTDSEIFLIVTTHHEDEQLTDITANLLGPIVANTKSMQARQVVLQNDAYGTRQTLVTA